MDLGGRPRLRSLFLPSAVLPAATLLAILPSSPKRMNECSQAAKPLHGQEWHEVFYFCNKFIYMFLLNYFNIN
jgi:hypothetical protein